MHDADRLLAPLLVDLGTHRAPHGFRYRIWIAALARAAGFPPWRRRHRTRRPRSRNLPYSFPEYRPDQPRDRPPVRPCRSARWRQRRSRRTPAAAVRSPRARCRARAGCRPCRSRPFGSSSMIAESPGPSRTRSPFLQISTFGTPQARASLACSDRCSASPWTGISSCGAHPRDHVAQFVPARMPRDVNHVGPVG